MSVRDGDTHILSPFASDGLYVDGVYLWYPLGVWLLPGPRVSAWRYAGGSLLHVVWTMYTQNATFLPCLSGRYLFIGVSLAPRIGWYTCGGTVLGSQGRGKTTKERKDKRIPVAAKAVQLKLRVDKW